MGILEAICLSIVHAFEPEISYFRQFPGICNRKIIKLNSWSPYFLYFPKERNCLTKNLTTGASIDSFMKVKANSAAALKKAIATYGPATASINTEAKTLKFYSKGIYSDKECSKWNGNSVCTKPGLFKQTGALSLLMHFPGYIPERGVNQKHLRI